MQINWLHVKMLDQSKKSKRSDFSCNSSVEYDTCMYRAVTQVLISWKNKSVRNAFTIKAMVANTSSSCTVPWVRDVRFVCTTKKDMDKAYWTHYGRITNQKVWRSSMKCVPNICYARMTVLILVSIWLCLQEGRIIGLAPITRVWSIFTFNQKQSSMRRVFFTLSYHSLLR